MVRKLILDCDPGLDDALALLLAAGDPELDLVAVTAVGGNVSLESTTRNALALREYLGFESVPVAAGASHPLVGPVRDAAYVHGESGLGNVTLPAAQLPLAEESAVDLIIRLLRDTPGEIHLVATGPLTTIALALAAEPRIVDWVASFTIMGGSYTRGNATPAAEFNIYADPEAAAAVFAASWDVVMVGLDLTLQAIVTEPIVTRMRALGRLGTGLVVPLATFWTNPEDDDWDGQAVHDVCAVAYVARPELFTVRKARVDVEVDGTFTRGETVVDFASGTPNATIPVRIDVAAFWDYALESWSRVTPRG